MSGTIDLLVCLLLLLDVIPWDINSHKQVDFQLLEILYAANVIFQRGLMSTMYAYTS